MESAGFYLFGRSGSGPLPRIVSFTCTQPLFNFERYPHVSTPPPLIVPIVFVFQLLR